jgi:uncharacterized protein with PIN domain
MHDTDLSRHTADRVACRLIGQRSAVNILVSIRFYEELNDFLPPERRKHEFTLSVKGSPSVKHLIESLGVPHTEVDLILVNGRSVPFTYTLQDGDIISAYPIFEAFDISTVSRLREKPLRTPKFILDIHLGKLSKYLRMFGFDSSYRNDYKDREIVDLSLADNRIILTRDRELLKTKEVVRGYWVRNTKPERQLKEILKHFDLKTLIAPFSICIVCNGKIEIIGKKDLQEKINQNIFSRFDEFFFCKDCGKIYWKGSHYKSMIKFIDKFIT